MGKGASLKLFFVSDKKRTKYGYIREQEKKKQSHVFSFEFPIIKNQVTHGQNRNNKAMKYGISGEKGDGCEDRVSFLDVFNFRGQKPKGEEKERKNKRNLETPVYIFKLEYIQNDQRYE
jgi:hypothetical protein